LVCFVFKYGRHFVAIFDRALLHFVLFALLCYI
jgi:hypothetical protein